MEAVNRLTNSIVVATYLKEASEDIPEEVWNAGREAEQSLFDKYYPYVVYDALKDSKANCSNPYWPLAEKTTEEVTEAKAKIRNYKPVEQSYSEQNYFEEFSNWANKTYHTFTSSPPDPNLVNGINAGSDDEILLEDIRS